jgi:GTP-binding protein
MTDNKAIERGRILFAQECDFLRPIVSLDDVPDTELPEVAFIGRSNVGKSSLINALTRRNGLARVSNTPGRTREINLFDLGHRMILVDLPGYGFARVSKTQSAAWRALISGYLKGRPQLARVCVLIDARHGVKDSDEDMMDLLDGAAVSFHTVLTKADKVEAKDLPNVLNAVAAATAKHTAGHPEVFVTSSTTGSGLAELKATLASVALPADPGYKPATAGRDRA